jgi:uncharacterized protein
MTQLALLILGLVSGLIAGAFGVGGGIIIVPALVLLFKQSMPIAVGTSLTVIILISISGAIRHWTLDNVNLSIVLFIAIGGVVGAICGASLLEKLPELYAKRALAVILVASAIRLWISK